MTFDHIFPDEFLQAELAYRRDRIRADYGGRRKGARTTWVRRRTKDPAAG